MSQPGYSFTSQPALPWSYKVIQPANPGLGNTFFVTVPNNAIYELIFVQFGFNTSATVITRIPQLQIYPAGFILGVPSMNLFSGGQAAALNVGWNYNAGQAVNNQYDSVTQSWYNAIPPKTILLPGDTLTCIVGNFQIGDFFNSIRVVVRNYMAYTPLAFT